MPKRKRSKKKKNMKERKATIPKALREQVWIKIFGMVSGFFFHRSYDLWSNSNHNKKW